MIPSSYAGLLRRKLRQYRLIGTALLRTTIWHLRQCGTNTVVVVDIVVVDVAGTRIRVELVIVVVRVGRAKPKPFNHIPICYGLLPYIP